MAGKSVAAAGQADAGMPYGVSECVGMMSGGAKVLFELSALFEAIAAQASAPSHVYQLATLGSRIADEYAHDLNAATESARNSREAQR